MTGLRIADGLTLDPDYIGGGGLAILAKKGAGKTYAGKVIAEELWAHKVPFVAVDPVGAWWGLRMNPDATGEGLSVPIFGGPHADVPLERTGGRLVADLIVDERLSAILDLSGFESHAAERQFMRDFLERLYRRNRDLVHLLIDEADLFAPQQPQPGDRPLLGAMENVVRRGRQHGIGATLITQRAAVLNKNVLSQVDGLIAMRITGIQDRDAIDDWVRGHADPDTAKQVKQTLAGLETGEGWVWIPELDILERTRIRAAATFNSSATPTRNSSTRRDPVLLPDLDLGALRVKMRDTIERIEADDPARLRARIRELEKQLANREPLRVEVPVFSDDSRAELSAAVARFAELRDDLGAVFTGAAVAVQQALAEVKPPDLSWLGEFQPRPVHPARLHVAASKVDAAPSKPDATTAPVRDGDGQFRPSGSQQRILDALAALDAIGVALPGKNQLALFAEAKPTSGGYRNNLSMLRTAGLIGYPEPAHVALTDAGRELAAPKPDLATTPVLHAYVRRMVGESRWRILETLIGIYPAAIARDNLAPVINVPPTSGGYRNNLSSLRTLGLVDYPTAGWVKASSVLMLEVVA